METKTTVSKPVQYVIAFLFLCAAFGFYHYMSVTADDPSPYDAERQGYIHQLEKIKSNLEKAVR